MKILVIEDNKKHLNDARVYSETLSGCTVDFVTTLAEAMESLREHEYDGVISDVFFPAEFGASAKTFENAIAIGDILCASGIHHVFNTAGNHHGPVYNGFLNKTAHAIFGEGAPGFLRAGLIIEAYPEDRFGEGSAKQWQAAFRYVLVVSAMRELADLGESVIGELVQILRDLDRWFVSMMRGFTIGDYGTLTQIWEDVHEQPFVQEVFDKYKC